jgi:hypothetical protein
MSRQLHELENVLGLLIEEHRRLLTHITTQQSAMRRMELDAMEAATHRQEASRLRIAGLDSRRRLLSQQLAKIVRLSPDATLKQIAGAVPQHGLKLMALRDELKGLMGQIAERTHVAGRLASSVLGHLNTAVRLFAGAVGQNGAYTKNGVPRVSGRIGIMEAVG